MLIRICACVATSSDGTKNWYAPLIIPFSFAPFQLRSKYSSMVLFPWLTLMNANCLPEAATAAQSTDGPCQYETSIPSMVVPAGQTFKASSELP